MRKYEVWTTTGKFIMTVWAETKSEAIDFAATCVNDKSVQFVATPKPAY